MDLERSWSDIPLSDLESRYQTSFQRNTREVLVLKIHCYLFVVVLLDFVLNFKRCSKSYSLVHDIFKYMSFLQKLHSEYMYLPTWVLDTRKG
jgi:hypothetical protein